jgi:hypothetical protein
MQPLFLQTLMFVGAIIWAALMFGTLPNPSSPDVKLTWAHAIAAVMLVIGAVGMIHVVGVDRLLDSAVCTPCFIYQTRTIFERY